MTPPGMDRLHPACAGLFERFPVRKSRRQKQAFREAVTALLQDAGWPVRTEGGGVLRSQNLVAGEPNGAVLLLTAHYDTPARMPLPNFIAPCNLALTLLYQLGLALLLLVPYFAVLFGLRWLGAPFPLPLLAGLAVLALFLWLMLAGPANPHNANDNTSGTLALVEVALTLPPALREGVALVFFDNEEKGLVGSGRFRARHGAMAGALLLNFDCVGNGDVMLFVLPRALRRDGTARRLQAAFAPQDGLAPRMAASPLTLYPSDQLYFKNGVGVVACREKRGVGLYVPRLHTARDTVLQPQNLAFLRDGVARLLRAE